jgi:hypothetical protein
MHMLWLHSGGKLASSVPAAALSVAAHAVLIGGAVYGSGQAARALESRVQETVFYLPPPDRAPVASHGDRVRYLRPAHSVASLAGSPDGQAHASVTRTRLPLDDVGADAAPRAAATEVPSSPDSVYSILAVDQGATRDESSGAPIYPPDLFAHNVEGMVTTRYVIDSLGRADTTSLTILFASHPGFVASVRDALPLMHFRPASIGGRHVRQSVEQNFVFRITAPVPAAAEHTRVTPAG